VARFLWVFPAVYLPRWLSPSLARRDPSPPWQWAFLLAFVGVRGVVALAAALAIPFSTASGAPFPYRDLILAITFGVIIMTLVVAQSGHGSHGRVGQGYPRPVLTQSGRSRLCGPQVGDALSYNSWRAHYAPISIETLLDLVGRASRDPIALKRILLLHPLHRVQSFLRPVFVESRAFSPEL
jgi:hypothetical protein